MRAWEREYDKYTGARPVDFAEDPSDWSGIDKVLIARRAQVRMFWDSRVPGSRAPESLYTAMIQAWFNQGYEVSEAESLLDEALEAFDAQNHGKLERLSGRILKALVEAPVDTSHSSHRFSRPQTWEEIRNLMPGSKKPESDSENPFPADQADLRQKILGGWLGQIAGGSYGTALEGYAGRTLRNTYGDRMNTYIKEPETLNDDITFELAVLKAAELATRNDGILRADDIADMWLEYIPFGWSAEYFALENLRRGIFPPESGRQGNFFSEWIGAQMRTMVCGYLAPGNPMKAAEYAWMDSSVSHDTNGTYAGIHSAVLSSLAFSCSDSRILLEKSLEYIPVGTEFLWLLETALESVRSHESHIESWESLTDILKTYNWIHAYPNMVAVVHALWFCGNDIGRAFRILGDCGADVDCNAGEVGSAMGIMFPIDPRWTDPFNDSLETYVPGLERLKISELADWTADIASGLK